MVHYWHFYPQTGQWRLKQNKDVFILKCASIQASTCWTKTENAYHPWFYFFGCNKKLFIHYYYRMALLGSQRITDVTHGTRYSISQKICTRSCCALLCCGYAIVHNEFTCIHEFTVFIHIHQGCFAGTGAIVRLPQCQWSKPDGCGKISQCITTTEHSKAKTVCIFLWIYCTEALWQKTQDKMN